MPVQTISHDTLRPRLGEAGTQDWIDAGLPTDTGHDALVGAA